MRATGGAIGAVVALAVLTAACGYVGDPLPPALNIVKPVTNLRVEEVGDRLLVSFTLPDETTEGLDWRKIAGVEFRIGVVPRPFDQNAWADGARPIPVTATEPGEVTLSVPAAQWDSAWTGKEVAAGVRSRNLKGRVSQWSNLVTLRIVAPLAPPSDLKAASHPKGVRLEWKSPANRFRVFRKAARDAEPVMLGETEEGSYIDAAAEFEQHYIYSVVAVDGTARSEASSEAGHTPRDEFAPETPRGLRVIAGVGTLELAWEPNTESDLQGYVIYRAVDGGSPVRLEGIRQLPSYSDKAVEPGRQYSYSIASIDLKGNESARGATVAATAPR